MCPFFPSVLQVLDVMASVPIKLFGVNRILGRVISLSACALAGGLTIPLIDFVFKYVKKIYNRIVREKKD